MMNVLVPGFQRVSFDDTLGSFSAYLRVVDRWDVVLFDSTIFVEEGEAGAYTGF